MKSDDFNKQDFALLVELDLSLVYYQPRDTDPPWDAEIEEYLITRIHAMLREGDWLSKLVEEKWRNWCQSPHEKISNY